MKKYQLTIIGGGPAGMSCALAAYRSGIKDILIIERRDFLGGILKQCIHDGFGLLSHGSSLTGPEFSRDLEEKILRTDIQIETGAFVSKIDYSARPYTIDFLSSEGELSTCTSDFVVIATGCREKPFGNLRIPGTRPAGIYSAGAAQYMMNMQNILPGKSAVILGLGDIGMIMARRMTLEGASVKMILGLEMTGLQRNFQRCIKDFEIPYAENHTIISVHGIHRLEGVTIAPLDEDRQPITEKKQYIPCDTLLVAAGLSPENGLCPSEEKEGVFLCGNVDHIFSLVDHVVDEGEYIGLKVASLILGETEKLSKSLQYAEKKRNSREESISTISAGDDMICCGCPRSCNLHVEVGEDGTLTVTGYTCPFGEKHAMSEFESKKRILTTTVKVKDTPFKLVPVRSDEPIPFDKFSEAMELIKSVEVDPDIKNGFIVIKNILRTGANIVATTNITSEE